MLNEKDYQELQEVFKKEAHANLSKLKEIISFERWEQNLKEIFLCFHNLRGSSGLLSYNSIFIVSSFFDEEFLNKMQDKNLLREIIHQAIVLIEKFLNEDIKESKEAEDFVEKFKTLK